MAKRREIQQLQNTVEDKERELQQMKLLPTQAATASAAEKDISKLRLEEGKRAPEGMVRGTAVVNGNIVYINLGGSLQRTSSGLLYQTVTITTLVLQSSTVSSLVLVDVLIVSMLHGIIIDELKPDQLSSRQPGECYHVSDIEGREKVDRT